MNPTPLAESKIEQNINYVFCGVIYTLHMVSLIILVRIATDSIEHEFRDSAKLILVSDTVNVYFERMNWS